MVRPGADLISMRPPIWRRRSRIPATPGPASSCAPAIRVGANQRVINLCDRLEVLVPLAIREQDRLDRAQHTLQLRSVETPDRRTRHDESPCPDAVRVEKRRQLVRDAVADEDGRTGPAGGDVNAYGISGVSGGHDVNAL